MTDNKEVIYNSLVIFFSIVLVVSGMEVGLAFTEGETGHKFCEGPEITSGSGDRLTFHPKYGYTAHPNLKFLRKSDKQEEWAWHSYNPDGFRDMYDSGAQNIVVVGDSFTEGWLADNNATYPHLLDRWSPNTTFHNYGMGGYGTDQELLVYRDVADEQDHKMVIVGYYFGNDMSNNVQSSPRLPQFGINNGSLIQTQSPTNETQSPTNEGGGILAGKYVQPFQDYLGGNTHTYRFIAPKLATSIRALTGEKRERPTPPSGAELAEQRQLTKHLLSAISSQAEQHDARVLIVGIPTRGEVNPSYPGRYSPEDAEKYMDVQREMIRNVSADSSHVEYLDLKPQLVDEHERGNQVYGTTDAHMNEYGYRITAQVIYRHLLEDGVIQSDGDVNLSREYDVERTSCPN